MKQPNKSSKSVNARSNSKNKAQAKSQAKVGTTKQAFKKNSRTFTVAAVVVLVGIIYGGYYGWQDYQHNRLANDFKTHAASYGAQIVDNPYITARACWKHYPTNKPDEVWTIARINKQDPYLSQYASNGYASTGYASAGYAGNTMATNYGIFVGKTWISGSSNWQWWAGTVQIAKMPVGQANINNGAYLTGQFDNRADYTSNGTPYTRPGFAFGSMTANYFGPRIATPGFPQYAYPLIKNLPACDY